MRCETCRSGTDSQCNAWIDCDGQRREIAHRPGEIRHATTDLVALDRAGCPRCGTPLPPASVDPDEDRGGLVVEAIVCRVCDYVRPATPMGQPEVRAWVLHRKALVQQRKEGSRW